MHERWTDCIRDHRSKKIYSQIKYIVECKYLKKNIIKTDFLTCN